MITNKKMKTIILFILAKAFEYLPFYWINILRNVCFYPLLGFFYNLNLISEYYITYLSLHFENFASNEILLYLLVLPLALLTPIIIGNKTKSLKKVKFYLLFSFLIDLAAAIFLIIYSYYSPSIIAYGLSIMISLIYLILASFLRFISYLITRKKLTKNA